MEIKTLEGQVFNVELDELYIKPVYNEDKVQKYLICTNEGNVEIELASYSEKKIANHMLYILNLCANSPIEVSFIPEVQMCQDFAFQAMEILNRAKLAYMNKQYSKENM